MVSADKTTLSFLLHNLSPSPCSSVYRFSGCIGSHLYSVVRNFRVWDIVVYSHQGFEKATSLSLVSA
ncbi:hypothetical protein E2C01_051597 [Portunus trituberculatus]|uniref:Uncharacterized protein n=1 Tax=Portunus trituberculatus TaxID=210409 RepID=A0A5B7GJJ8_PORTR|nr:hypothetical protein [Portunus trituberculatus]